jgi:hypothetical protein
MPAFIAAWRGYQGRRRAAKEGPERMPVPD